jgi:hypothetical protein
MLSSSLGYTIIYTVPGIYWETLSEAYQTEGTCFHPQPPTPNKSTVSEILFYFLEYCHAVCPRFGHI